MAVVLVEGFDAYNGVTSTVDGNMRSGIWQTLGASVILAAGRFGGQAVQVGGQSGTGNQLVGALPTSLTQGALGFAVKFTTMPGDSGYTNFALTDPNLDGITIQVLNNGSLRLCSTTNASTLTTIYATTATNIINVNTWHYIELEFTIANSGGVLNLYVDGALVSSGTYDTLITSTTVSSLYLGPTNSVNIGVYLIDDLYITDTPSRLGEQKVETLYPSADSAQKQWTASTGSDNYAMVDETLMSSTDYIVSSTVGDFDLYDFGNLSSTANTISAITVSTLAEKDNVGTRAIALPVKSGATTTDGANNYLSGSYILASRILETDPNTSTVWTVSGVNSLQAGVKVTI